MGDSGFGNSPIFILVANNRIYSNLSVCQGSPDKIIAVVEDNSGKHWQIELKRKQHGNKEYSGSRTQVINVVVLSNFSILVCGAGL